jgi:hypothetical protein
MSPVRDREVFTRNVQQIGPRWLEQIQVIQLRRDTPQATQKMVRLETARLSTKKRKEAAATAVSAHTKAVSMKFDFDTAKRGATMKTLHRLLSANQDLSVRIVDSQDRDDLKEAMGAKKWKSIADRLGS